MVVHSGAGQSGPEQGEREEPTRESPDHRTKPRRPKSQHDRGRLRYGEKESNIQTLMRGNCSVAWLCQRRRHRRADARASRFRGASPRWQAVNASQRRRRRAPNDAADDRTHFVLCRCAAGRMRRHAYRGRQRLALRRALLPDLRRTLRPGDDPLSPLRSLNAIEGSGRRVIRDGYLFANMTPVQSRRAW